MVINFDEIEELVALNIFRVTIDKYLSYINSNLFMHIFLPQVYTTAWDGCATLLGRYRIEKSSLLTTYR